MNIIKKLIGIILLTYSIFAVAGQNDIEKIPDTSNLDAPVYIYVLKSCSYDAESAKMFQTLRFMYPNLHKSQHENLARNQIKEAGINKVHSEKLWHIFQYVWKTYEPTMSPSMVWWKTYSTCRDQAQTWWDEKHTIPPLNQYIYPIGFLRYDI